MKTKIAFYFVPLIVILGNVFLGYGTAYAWSRLHNGLNTYPQYVYPNIYFSSETQTAISNACSQWNSAGAGSLVLKSSVSNNQTIYPQQNGYNDFTKGNRGQNTYVSQCFWYLSSDSKCREADFDLNTYYSFANDGSTNAIDVGDVVTHELGHMLGLNDVYSTGPTMYAYSSYGQIWRRSIEQDDKNGILSIY